jgi:hypothetical protein
MQCCAPVTGSKLSLASWSAQEVETTPTACRRQEGRHTYSDFDESVERKLIKVGYHERVGLQPGTLEANVALQGCVRSSAPFCERPIHGKYIDLDQQFLQRVLGLLSCSREYILEPCYESTGVQWQALKGSLCTILETASAMLLGNDAKSREISNRERCQCK